MGLHDRQSASGPESLAVNDAHAAPTAAARVFQKVTEGGDGVGDDSPVQVEVGFDPEPAAPQSFEVAASNAAAREAEHVARSDVRRPVRLDKIP